MCSLFVSHKCWARDVTVVNVFDLLQLCCFPADTCDVNTFLQLSRLSETTSGTVCEHTRHVSMLDDALIIVEGLHGLVMAIIT